MTARTFQLNVDGIVWQAFGVDFGHRAGEHRAQRTVDVTRHFDEFHFFTAFDSGLGFFNQHVVERFFQTVFLRFGVETGHIVGFGHRKQAAEIQTAGFPMFNTLAHVEQISATNHVVKFADTQLCHDLTHFFGDEEEVIHHMLGLAREFLAQIGVLRCNTHRAGIQMAFAHHDAAFHDQRRGGKTEFIRTQQRADSHVTSGFHLTIGLHAHTAAQAVQHQCLLGFCQTDLPRATAMFDRRPRRCARTTVMTCNHHMVGLALGNASGNRTDTDFGYQFHADVAMGRNIFQIVNQLRQIFNRINIMVGWGRNQAHTGNGMAQFTDVIGNLATGQLTPFTGFCALCHFDLDLVGAGEVFSGHTKATRSHLLDAAAQRITRFQRQIGFHVFCTDDALQAIALFDGDAFQLVAVTGSIFTAFTRIALAADTVHGNGEGGVCFGRNRTERHRARGKALHDFFSGFDFIQRNGFGGVDFEFKQTAQRQMALALVVDDFRVLFVRVEIVGAGAVLQLGDGIGCPHMLFTTGTPCVFAASIQTVRQHGVGAESRFVHTDGFFGDFKNADTFHLAGRARKVFADGFAGEANRFKQLRTAIAHVGRNAHFGHDFRQTFANGFDVVINCFFSGQIAGQFFVDFCQCFHRQIGVNRFRAITRQHRKVMHFTRSACFHDQARAGAQTACDQMLVNRRQCQQRRNCHLAGAQAAVADDEDVFTALDRVHGFGAQRCNFRFHTLVTPYQGVGDVQCVAAEFALGVLLNITQFCHVGEVQHGLGDFKAHGWVDLVDVQQIRFRADEGHQAHHNRFPNRVDGRIGHLREQLFEVVVKRFIFIRQHGERAIVTHRTNGFFAVGSHRCNQEFHIFLGETKGLLAIQQRDLAFGFGRGFAAALHVVQTDAQVFNPLLVGFAVGESGFEFFIVNHATLFEVDQEHFAGLQTPFAHDFVFRHGQHAGFRTHDDQIVIGDAVARGAQAVAIQRCTDLATIGKHDGSGAIPRF